MKFLVSEGRRICLLEKEDGEMLLQHTLPQIELLLVPITIKEHIENTHVWPAVIQKVKNGLHGVVYF